MSARRSGRAPPWLLALALASSAPALACGPRKLPDLTFGTAADETGLGSSADSSSSAEEPGTASLDESVDDELGTDTSTDELGTSESSSSATGMETDEAEDEGQTWGIPPDVTNEPCTPLAQDCFPTHKCVPYATEPDSTFLDANKCVPIVGDKQWGEPCTLSDYNGAQDDCDGEGFCWNLELIQGELHGTCVPFCIGSPQDLMCPLGWNCLFTGAVALCAKQCDPLIQDCPVDFGCYWLGNAFDCGPTGTPAADKEGCDSANDCLPGLACVDAALVPGCPPGELSCCTPFCELGGMGGCPPPRSCEPFFTDPPPLLEAIGVCVQ